MAMATTTASIQTSALAQAANSTENSAPSLAASTEGSAPTEASASTEDSAYKQATETLSTICETLRYCQKDLHDLEDQFGLFHNAGTRESGQKDEAKYLATALEQEKTRFEWLKSDLRKKNIQCVPPEQLKIANHGLQSASDNLVVAIRQNLLDTLYSVGKKKKLDRMAKFYRALNRELHSTMAQAARAAEFLRFKPTFTWGKHQCYKKTRDGTIELIPVSDNPHPAH